MINSKKRIILAGTVMAALSLAGCADRTEPPSFVETRYSDPPPVTRQGLSSKPILRTGEIEGAHFVLIERTPEKDGKRVICKKYVDRVKRDVEQPEPKPPLDVAYECTYRQ